MKLSKTFKKVLFFWTIFHLIGYTCYLFKIAPVSSGLMYSQDDNNFVKNVKYYLVPRYVGDNNDSELDVFYTGFGASHMTEIENFYPFHKFTYSWGGYNGNIKVTLGIFGYYGTSEFLVYVVVPYFVLFFAYVYKKFIN